MKRTLLLWSLLLSSVIGCSSANDDEIPGYIPNESENSQNGNNQGPVVYQPLKFAVMSDIHFGNDVAEGPLVKVPKALKNITSYGELDALVIAGDLTNGGELGQYQELMETFTNPATFTNPVKNFYFVMGNHDNYIQAGQSNFQQSLKYFNGDELYPLQDYRVLNGYPFIMVSTLNGCNNDLVNIKDGTTAYPFETLQWLDEHLSKASKECPGKPIFVFTHVPPRWTCYSTWPELENGAGWCMQRLNPTLNKYPQVILFAGHSHYPVGDPRSIHQGANPNSQRNNYYTVINTGSTTYCEIHPDAVEGLDNGIHPDKFGYVTEGLIVEVSEDGNVKIRRYDTYRNEEIAADKPWILRPPFDGSQFTYADIRNADDNPLNKNLYSGGNPPAFGDDAKLTISRSASAVNVEFPQATDDDCVFRYSVKVYDVKSGACAGQASIFSRFYLNSEKPEKFLQIIKNLNSETEYKVEVIAYDSYENASEALVANFTTR